MYLKFPLSTPVGYEGRLAHEMDPTTSGSEHTHGDPSNWPHFVLAYPEEADHSENIYETISDNGKEALRISRDCESYECPLPSGESALLPDQLNTRNVQPTFSHGEERMPFYSCYCKHSQLSEGLKAKLLLCVADSVITKR
ncbi:hypothetical protein PoB_000375000 [Plakobranchus ocellatus]|uniref:Uncharacterized protein n=1 Tax=Plakobranchus ocellatus TaxID=259542 RepID=A0AAV3Y3L2_9GAST|nr:hypothetical protein PoB_000375000 [Plakobranchus ocellatus]